MRYFKEIPPNSVTENPFTLIGEDWMLITAGSQEKLNTMTASWGGVGVLWNKNVAFIFIRPQRYTREFLDEYSHFTLNFFEEHRRELQFCGSKSGRDCDKIAKTGLIPVYSEKAPYFKQARMVMVCKKLYCQSLDRESVIDPKITENYAKGDYHFMYVGEIEKVLVSSPADGAELKTIPRELMFS